MKKNFRQLLALFLCLVFVFSVLPTVAMAEGETVPEKTQTEEDLQLNDDGNFVGGEDDRGGDTSLGGDNGLDDVDDLCDSNDDEFDDLVDRDGESQTGTESTGSEPDEPVGLVNFVTVQDGDTPYKVVFLLQEPEGPSIPLLGGCGESYAEDSQSSFERSFLLTVVSNDLDPEHPENVTVAPDTVQSLLSVQDISFSIQRNWNNTTEPDGHADWTPGSRACTVSAAPQAGFEGILTACFTFNSQSYTIQVEVHYRPQGSEPDEPICSVPVNYGGASYEIVFFYQDPNPERPNIALWRGDGRPYSDDDTEGFDCSYLLAAVEENTETLAADDVQNRITVKSITFTGENEDGSTSPKNWTLDWEAGAYTCRLTAPCKAGFSGTLNAVFDFNDGVTTQEYTLRLPLVYERDPYGGPSGPSGPICAVPVSVGESSYNVIFFFQGPDENIALWRGDGRPYSDYDTEGFDCSYLLGAVVGESNNLAADDVQNRITVKSITFTGENEDGPTNPDNQNWDLTWTSPQHTCRLTAPCKAGFSGKLEAVFDFNDGVTTQEYTLRLPLVYERDPYASGVPSDMTIQEVRFGEQVVTVGAGFIENGALSVGGNAGSIFEPGQQMSFYRHYVLGGMLNYNTHNASPALKAFFDRIMSCSVEVESCEGTAPTVSEPMKVAYPELEDAELYTFEITSSEPSQPFDATFVLTFTYRPDDWEAGDPPESYTLRFSAFYRESPNKTIDASDLNTTEKLNAALKSKAAFASYLEAVGVNYNWDGVVTLNLPAVEYEGKVVCDIQPDDDCGVRLHGTSDPDTGRTTMHALDDRRGLFIIDNITFTANGVTQSYGGESFTCGVLVTGSEQAVGSSIGGIDGCSFSGYQYAVRGTPTGYPGSIQGCSFTNCTYGLYIDCEGLNGMVNVDVSGNTFSACQDAICIPNLPASISPYIYRIHDNLFLNSGQHDLNITQPGTFFCYGNYFGIDENTRRTALLSEGPNTSIIVNPCRAVPYSSTYWIDPALPTRILNKNASSLAIDVSTFGNNQNVTINVVDLGDSGISPVGTWTFGGTGA